MDLYLVLRRNGWSSMADLEAAAERSTVAGEHRDDVNWIRTYVLDEGDGRLGTTCYYEATGPDALRAHAQEAELPVDEIVRIGGTLVVAPDPAEAQSSA